MTEPAVPSLSMLEGHICAGRSTDAFIELLRILDQVNQGSGQLGGLDLGIPVDTIPAAELARHISTRVIAAYGQLLAADPEIAPVVLEALLLHHRWIEAMVAVSGFGTLNHLIAALPRDEAGAMILDARTLPRFLLLFSPASGVGMGLDQCVRVDDVATTVALLGYIGARTMVSAHAVAFRERALAWLPGKLGGMNFGDMLLDFLPNIYMHCSYAFARDKHRIKAELIGQMRRAMLKAGAAEITGAPPARQRPRIVVVCEHFHTGHSVFRTHSRAVRSLKERFEVIGLADGAKLDEPARDCFHEVIGYPEGSAVPSAVQCAARIAELRPDVVFHLGVGMSDKSLALASLRLAPVQCVSYGHTATTMSPVIDYMILPDDFVGAEDLYSEKLLRFPPESIPYAPPAATEAPVPARVARTEGRPVRIAVPASIMKINATFLQALGAAENRSGRPVEFHFFPLGAVGLAFHHLEREVTRILPSATVHAQSPRETYLERLGACDFFVSPFPYGNMNSIVDAIVMAVPGVCLDGEEAHAHADAAIFRRLGLPEELIASSVDGFVAAIVRLIDDAEWRRRCQKIAAEIDLDATMYRGDETIFCDEMLKLVPVGVAG